MVSSFVRQLKSDGNASCAAEHRLGYFRSGQEPISAQSDALERTYRNGRAGQTGDSEKQLRLVFDPRSMVMDDQPAVIEFANDQ